MLKFTGKSVVQGIAIGKIYCYTNHDIGIQQGTITGEEAAFEIERFHSAQTQVLEQLQHLYEDALARVGKELAQIFEVHQMMIKDSQYVNDILEGITKEHWNVEYAVYQAGEKFAKLLAQADSEYMSARAADVRDMTQEIIRVLLAIETKAELLTEPVIVLADELMPSDTMKMEKSKVLSLVTRYGTAASHATILARGMNIPSLIGVNLESVEDHGEGNVREKDIREENLDGKKAAGKNLHGKMAVVDGFDGCIYIEPTEELLRTMQRKQKKYQRQQEKLTDLIGKETITTDGRKVKLYANIAAADEVSNVLNNDGEGIGLFRSEFLYLEKTAYPDEEEQFAAYREVAERMNGKKVIIRTLDIGVDKKADYFQLRKEENPAMGYRAIRICLDRPELFKTQLRAIYRASAWGNIAILFPMIISIEEIRRIKQIVEGVKQELLQENRPVGNVELGIMIETPAAVMISDKLAEEAAFFSIGTNDLIQYTLAIDRQNPELEDLYDPHHEAVLRMIRMTVEHAHKAGITVGICGELAGDESLLSFFMEIGVDELSVAPAALLGVRKKIREL